MRPAAEIHRKKLLPAVPKPSPKRPTCIRPRPRSTIRAPTLPAADCPGIETRLTLKKDGTFDLHMKYIDRDAEFDTKGGYSVRGNLLTLTPENGEGVEYYKVEENRLRRLDADKQPVTGPLAENYVLKKTE